MKWEIAVLNAPVVLVDTVNSINAKTLRSFGPRKKKIS